MCSWFWSCSLLISSNFSKQRWPAVTRKLLIAIWPPKCCRIWRGTPASNAADQPSLLYTVLLFSLSLSLTHSLPFTENWLEQWSCVCWLTSNTHWSALRKNWQCLPRCLPSKGHQVSCSAISQCTGELAWLGPWREVAPLFTCYLRKLPNLLIMSISIRWWGAQLSELLDLQTGLILTIGGLLLVCALCQINCRFAWPAFSVSSQWSSIL